MKIVWVKEKKKVKDKLWFKLLCINFCSTYYIYTYIRPFIISFWHFFFYMMSRPGAFPEVSGEEGGGGEWPFWRECFDPPPPLIPNHLLIELMMKPSYCRISFWFWSKSWWRAKAVLQNYTLRDSLIKQEKYPLSSIHMYLGFQKFTVLGQFESHVTKLSYLSILPANTWTIFCGH